MGIKNEPEYLVVHRRRDGRRYIRRYGVSGDVAMIHISHQRPGSPVDHLGEGGWYELWDLDEWNRLKAERARMARHQEPSIQDWQATEPVEDTSPKERDGLLLSENIRAVLARLPGAHREAVRARVGADKESFDLAVESLKLIGKIQETFWGGLRLVGAKTEGKYETVSDLGAGILYTGERK